MDTITLASFIKEDISLVALHLRDSLYYIHIINYIITIHQGKQFTSPS